MSDTQPLPDDILEYLERIHTMNWYTADIIDEAKSLHAKYRPKPETLADVERGIVGWSRTFRIEGAGQIYTESSLPGGVDLAQDIGKVDLRPWPEIEGINPADLLNDGWQIRNASDVPDGWKIAAYSGDDSYTSPSIAVEAPLVVFCRPPKPQGEDT